MTTPSTSHAEHNPCSNNIMPQANPFLPPAYADVSTPAHSSSPRRSDRNKHGFYGWADRTDDRAQLLVDSTLCTKPCSSRTQRAINRWRLGLRFSFAQQIKQIISADSAILQIIPGATLEALGSGDITLCADFFSLLNNSLLWSFPLGTDSGVKNVPIYQVLT